MIKNTTITKTTCKRMAKTFIQAFVGTLITTIATGQYNINEWKTWGLTVCSSAIACGMAAVMNLEQKGSEE